MSAAVLENIVADKIYQPEEIAAYSDREPAHAGARYGATAPPDQRGGEEIMGEGLCG